MYNLFVKIFVVFPVRALCKARNVWLIWFWYLNRKGRKAFNKNQPILNETEKRILEDLKRDGIATAHIEELFSGQNLLLKLQEYTKPLLSQPRSERAKSSFLHYLWERRSAELTWENPFLPFALSKPVISVANSYFGMFTKFYYFMHALTIPVPAGSPEDTSQRWHRDPEDKKTCKMFLYLTDVNEEAGPFIYIKGSHYGGKWGKLFPCQLPKGGYISPDEVSKIIPDSDIKVCTGKAGTIIFCDTAGMHKGGYATKKERIMFTTGYHSTAGIRFIRLRLSDGLKNKLASLSPEVKFALTPLPKKLISLAFFKFKKSFSFGYEED